MQERLFHNKTFDALAVGQTMSNIGNSMSMFAVALAVKQITGSDLLLGLVALARATPLITFSLLGGSLADRMDKRRLLQITQPAAAIILAALAAMFWLGLPKDLTVWLLFAGTFLIGLTGAFDVPAVQASVPVIVNRENLVQALGIMTLTRQVGNVAAPPIAGLLIGFFGFPITFAVAAACYLVFVTVLQFIRWASVPSAKKAPIVTAIVEGLRYSWATPVILGVLLMDLVANVFAQPAGLIVIFGSDVLRLDTAQIGVLAAGYPLGAIIGGIVLSVIASKIPPTVRMVILFTVLYGAGIVVFGLSTAFFLSFASLIVMGVADVVGETLRNTLLQLSVPNELRGRVSALMLIFVRGGPNVGQFRSGLIAQSLGPLVSAVSGGIICMIGAFFVGSWMANRMARHAAAEEEPVSVA